ncbi:MAG: hypothetical protein ABFS86_03920 [Planctomycetota bacterium]
MRYAVGMSDEERKPYRAIEKNGMWSVVDGAGRTAAACGGEPNARHYETLLNEAHDRGYRAGYRAAKNA